MNNAIISAVDTADFNTCIDCFGHDKIITFDFLHPYHSLLYVPLQNHKNNMSVSSLFSSFQAPRQLLLKKQRKAKKSSKTMQFDPLAFHEVFSGSGQVAIKPSWIEMASWTSARFVRYQSGRPPPEIKEADYKRNKMEIHHDPSNHYF